MARRGGYKLLFFLYLVNTKGTNFVFTDNIVFTSSINNVKWEIFKFSTGEKHTQKTNDSKNPVPLIDRDWDLDQSDANDI